MKKIFGLLLIAGVFAIATSCGDKKKEEGTTGADTTATAPTEATPVAPDAPAADTTKK
jgi:hypothetical protein